jgi:simple sugar transport system ATP-binding protein
VNNVSFTVKRGEILCIAGIDGNGQSELVYALTGLERLESGEIYLNGNKMTKLSVRERNVLGMGHIPEDRHKDGLILDYSLADNLVLKKYFTPEFQHHGFIKFKEIYAYADQLITAYDIRSSQGPKTIVRSMSGGNQQKAIVAREINLSPEVLIAVQPTRGLDVGAIEYIHKQLVEQRDAGRAILLISLELDEVMNVSDRILVLYEGEFVADLRPEETTVQELGLYMAGSKRKEVAP